MNRLRSQKGFTLVELMVVVAIIGILSAVAIPNFRRYQAKSKTSEAKVNLSAIYTAEMSHFTDMDQYSSCLNTIGFTPGGQAQDRYYTVGFAGVDVPGGAGPANCDAAGVSHFLGEKGSADGVSGANGLQGTGTGAVTTAINNATPSFLAGAAGIIDAGSTILDTWTVDQNKSIVHTNTGY